MKQFASNGIGTRMLSLMLVGAIVLCSSVSAFAQESLPGDLLYPIKVGVNEKISSFIALTSESKANVETTLAVRRLEEAEKLALMNRMTPAVEKEIDQQFAAHTHKLESHLMSLQEDGKSHVVIALSDSFDARLAVHQLVLEGLAAKTIVTSSTTPNQQITSVDSTNYFARSAKAVSASTFVVSLVNKEARDSIASRTGSTTPNEPVETLSLKKDEERGEQKLQEADAYFAELSSELGLVISASHHESGTTTGPLDTSLPLKMKENKSSSSSMLIVPAYTVIYTDVKVSTSTIQGEVSQTSSSSGTESVSHQPSTQTPSTQNQASKSTSSIHVVPALPSLIP